MAHASSGVQPEVHFYHLEVSALEQVFPALLEKVQAMQWRAVVQVTDVERMRWLSNALWTWREDSFLAHGTEEEGNGPDQPFWMSTLYENPNRASVRFVVDGLDFVLSEGMHRVIYLFDSYSEEILEKAREQWRCLRKEALPLFYWKQKPDASWVRQSLS